MNWQDLPFPDGVSIIEYPSRAAWLQARHRPAPIVDPSAAPVVRIALSRHGPRPFPPLRAGVTFQFKRWMEKSMLDPNEDPTPETEAQEASKDGSETPTEPLSGDKDE